MKGDKNQRSRILKTGFNETAPCTKWGCPDLNRGLRLPKPVGYQATPQPLNC
jgi:hypothetical protein